MRLRLGVYGLVEPLIITYSYKALAQWQFFRHAFFLSSLYTGRSGRNTIKLSAMTGVECIPGSKSGPKSYGRGAHKFFQFIEKSSRGRVDAQGQKPSFNPTTTDFRKGVCTRNRSWEWIVALGETCRSTA
ncbi:hypothetical protein LENED_010534 [Lentinula edodes]|uniref:Uncharacterized protein n=1 Tax=Lentinula edodes TaxID=5353 RepID=A0A1Q3EMQ2_LENED|nr:hypothetical protein LENED_010534 [Lentinula edodes]